MNDNCAKLIEQLIQIRKNKSITKRELSNISNIAQPSIARFENLMFQHLKPLLF